MLQAFLVTHMFDVWITVHIDIGNYIHECYNSYCSSWASFMGTLSSDAKVAYFCHKKKSSGSLTDSVKFCCKINVLN